MLAIAQMNKCIQFKLYLQEVLYLLLYVHRMPALDPYRPNQGHVEGGGSSSAIVPYQPIRVSAASRSSAGLPPKVAITNFFDTSHATYCYNTN